MAQLSQLFSLALQNVRQTLSSNINDMVKVCVRNASKKGGTSTRNRGGHPRPKHRGPRVTDGDTVHAGKMLVKQHKTRFHPGLNVGFGRNGTLYALEEGKVIVTCEKINPNWDHSWIKQNYAERKSQTIYKKHFNVIPMPQHKRFKLIEKL
ncbi:hypothetical protein DMN91_004888 [Ooceraea biroi]|uniref:Large ribosomal subunit protein bL27m n=1 Tax=Ooceraea biroi TaxID=2015173 RepID=A0A026VYV4_OOCBI|nr:uncharacterized protein LOC105285254 [Ooceraea biroi]EZA48855.1 39S ribosomal protein L27, mitochondrial [Ooceraea biroi]RLU22610.1 hypothetical protein DMN91_004888 [Ooceraea biroi]